MSSLASDADFDLSAGCELSRWGHLHTLALHVLRDRPRLVGYLAPRVLSQADTAEERAEHGAQRTVLLESKQMKCRQGLHTNIGTSVRKVQTHESRASFKQSSSMSALLRPSWESDSEDSCTAPAAKASEWKSSWIQQQGISNPSKNLR